LTASSRYSKVNILLTGFFPFMTPFEIVIVLSILGVGWFWYANMSAREVGLGAVRQLCDEEGVQLLDETIAIAHLRPRRDHTGRLCWMRVYQFEYSETGDNRRSGSVHLLGREVIFLTLGPRPVRGTGINPPPWNGTDHEDQGNPPISP
jgi:hypothetical protein